MSSLPVFADAWSRLHADIALIRLIRAGIPADRISAVFPRRQAPNGVCCWLKNFNRIPRTTAWPAAAAGLLGRLFRTGLRAAHVEEELDHLGLTPDTSKRLLEKIESGRIVLCVHARTEAEAAVAWHIFTHVGFENITLPASDFMVVPERSFAGIPQLASLAA